MRFLKSFCLKKTIKAVIVKYGFNKNISKFACILTDKRQFVALFWPFHKQKFKLRHLVNLKLFSDLSNEKTCSCRLLCNFSFYKKPWKCSIMEYWWWLLNVFCTNCFVTSPGQPFTCEFCQSIKKLNRKVERVIKTFWSF